MPMSANIFNFDVLEEFEVGAFLNELNGSQAQAICSHCGADITDADYECPNCGVVLRVAPKRKTAATRELLQVIESENMNGDYHIYKLPDGSLYCDCLSFLFQRGVREEYGRQHASTSGSLLKAGTLPYKHWCRCYRMKIRIQN